MNYIQKHIVYDTANNTSLEFTGQLLAFGDARDYQTDTDCQVRIYEKYSEQFSDKKQYVGSVIFTSHRNTSYTAKQKIYTCLDTLDEVEMWLIVIDDNFAVAFQGYHIVMSALKDAAKDPVDHITSELKVYFQALYSRL
jgi:hypothetical protein